MVKFNDEEMERYEHQFGGGKLITFNSCQEFSGPTPG